MGFLPNGKYTAQAAIWTYIQSKQDNWYLKIKFQVTGPTHEGETVSGMLHFAKDWQIERSDKVLRHLGWTGTDRIDCLDNGGALDTHPIDIIVGQETFDGRAYSVVKEFVLPSDIDRAGLSKFLSELKLPTPPRGRNNIE